MHTVSQHRRVGSAHHKQTIKHKAGGQSPPYMLFETVISTEGRDLPTTGDLLRVIKGVGDK
jgi:hypothetical protein